ncbi:MAG: hypothetical protein JSR33_00850 [Proteobacteria bacterium]|nr:hypothetical protein [Pseudomonadota bacterium]
MSKLIQALINQEHPQRQAPFSTNLGQEAQRIYQEAAEHMRSNRQGFTQEFKVTEDKLKHGVQARVTAELDSVNLHDLHQFKHIQRLIIEWNPNKSHDNFRACDAVKKALMTCLIDARKKQQLQRSCQEYKAHLAADIRSELTNEFPNVSRQYGFNLPEPTTSYKKPLRPIEKPSTLDHFLTHEAKSLPLNQHEGLQKAIKKYEAVTTLQQSLTTAKPAPAQVHEFKQTLQQRKPILEDHRDSKAVRFLKGVAAVLTLGVAALCGIFSVKGEEASKNMQKVINRPSMAYMPR